ncbi:hypothetical protein [Streptomyces sp. S1]|uniref:hypothetical protein n=1 Tax=Streptomyces sp. S1 TaxID=718288 RepID=UPI003D742DEF
MRSRPRRIDLFALTSMFVAGLVLVLVCAGVQPDAVATLVVGFATLYATWTGLGRSPEAPSDEDRSD